MDTHDRFDFKDDIKRVTAGDGGEVWLITGSEKTAVIDCGMAYCGEELALNVKEALGERKLDYAILSHTHYDHIGGLPYLRRLWPELISFGAEYGKEILEKESALSQIEKMSEYAWQRYRKNNEAINVLMEGLKIDRILREGETLSLGDKEIIALETPGHTTCSLSFLMEPNHTFFPSETAGVYIEEGMINGVLKSYKDTIESIEKCRNIKIENIIAPHYGQVPQKDVPSYWDMAIYSAEESKNFILKLKEENNSFEEILKKYTEKFWVGVAKEQQPKEAFLLNANNLIKLIFKEF